MAFQIQVVDRGNPNEPIDSQSNTLAGAIDDVLSELNLYNETEGYYQIVINYIEETNDESVYQEESEVDPARQNEAEESTDTEANDG